MSDEDNLPKCDMCGTTKNVELQPSRKTLVMGPFPGSFYFGTPMHVVMERRCPKCERKVSRDIKATLKSVLKTAKEDHANQHRT